MNIVKGTILKFEEPIFIGSYPKVKFSYNAIHTVEVIKDSYGSLKGQHSFTLKVIESTEKLVGDTFRKMGRNIYPTAEIISQPENLEKISKEKKERSDASKDNKYTSWYLEAMNEGKYFKLEKIPFSVKIELEERFGKI
jgi:hypothetical protein